MTPRWMTFGDVEQRRDRPTSTIAAPRTMNFLEKTAIAPYSKSRFQKAPYSPALVATTTQRNRHSILGQRPPPSRSTTSAPALVQTSTSVGLRSTRPVRAATVTQGERRKQPEQVDGKRLSIFTRGKSPKRPSQATNDYPSLPSPGSRDARVSANDSRDGHYRVDSEDDYYRHLKKLSISPPFNFHHITHTKRQELPCLENSTQKELVAEFWAVSGYQNPKRHLKDINADDLMAKHKTMGISRGSPSSIPSSPTTVTRPPGHARVASPLMYVSPPELDHIEPESLANALEEKPSFQIEQNQSEPVWLPKRSTSMGASRWSRCEAAPSTLPGVSTMSDVNESPKPSAPDNFESPQLVEHGTALDAVQEETEIPRICESQSSVERHRRKHAKTASNKASKTSLKSSATPTWSSGSSPPIGKNALSVRTNTSSSYTHAAATSSTVATDTRRTTVTQPSWEDDVDFCYEFEAESTCDFDWDIVPRSRELSIESDGGVYLFPPTLTRTPNSTSSPTSKLSPSTSSIADSSIAHRRSHKKRPSVGHRGFLNARRPSNDPLAQAKAIPPPLETPVLPRYSGPLSPVFSIIGSQEDLTKPVEAIGSMHFAGFDSIGIESLSDPESVRSSRHRKLSSYGSYESIARPPPATRSDPTGRWSAASLNSLPELLHGKRHPEARTSAQSKRISKPIPVSAPVPDETTEPLPALPSLHGTRVVPIESGDFTMRRPETPGDRAVLHNAGRAVQRGRPGTSYRSSSLLHTSLDLPQQPHPVQKPTWV